MVLGAAVTLLLFVLRGDVSGSVISAGDAGRKYPWRGSSGAGLRRNNTYSGNPAPLPVIERKKDGMKKVIKRRPAARQSLAGRRIEGGAEYGGDVHVH
jgi:hypothetical protein